MPEASFLRWDDYLILEDSGHPRGRNPPRSKNKSDKKCRSRLQWRRCWLGRAATGQGAKVGGRSPPRSTDHGFEAREESLQATFSGRLDSPLWTPDPG